MNKFNRIYLILTIIGSAFTTCTLNANTLDLSYRFLTYGENLKSIDVRNEFEGFLSFYYKGEDNFKLKIYLDNNREVTFESKNNSLIIYSGRVEYFRTPIRKEWNILEIYNDKGISFNINEKRESFIDLNLDGNIISYSISGEGIIANKIEGKNKVINKPRAN